MVLVLAGTPVHGAYPRHVVSRVDQHIAFGIIIGAPAIAIGRVAGGLADTLNQVAQANG